MKRLITQAKLCPFCLCLKYKYGFEVPCNLPHAPELDRLNGNTIWFDVNVTKHKKLQEYNVFIDKSISENTKVPAGYHKIWVYTIFDVKHNGRH